MMGVITVVGLLIVLAGCYWLAARAIIQTQESPPDLPEGTP